MPSEEDHGSDLGIVVETKKKTRLKRPRLFRILMHNDDYTTRDFVVYVLQSVFHHSEGESVKIMLHVHNTGSGVAGVFTREVAETKVAKVQRLAEQNGFPLRLSMEPESETSGENE